MKIIVTGLACLLATSAFAAGQYVTYRTGHDEYGRLAWQIDTATIRQEGPYRTFWNQVWDFSLKQPQAYSLHEGMFFLSQKFAVDCAHRRFGADFIDSNIPSQHRHSASLDRMRWDALNPVMAKTVCGEK